MQARESGTVRRVYERPREVPVRPRSASHINVAFPSAQSSPVKSKAIRGSSASGVRTSVPDLTYAAPVTVNHISLDWESELQTLCQERKLGAHSKLEIEIEVDAGAFPPDEPAVDWRLSPCASPAHSPASPNRSWASSSSPHKSSLSPHLQRALRAPNSSLAFSLYESSAFSRMSAQQQQSPLDDRNNAELYNGIASRLSRHFAVLCGGCGEAPASERRRALVNAC